MSPSVMTAFSLPLRRNEEDALAGLVQLAQRFQYGGGRLNKELFNFNQGWSPLW